MTNVSSNFDYQIKKDEEFAESIVREKKAKQLAESIVRKAKQLAESIVREKKAKQLA